MKNEDQSGISVSRSDANEMKRDNAATHERFLKLFAVNEPVIEAAE
jgi:hypothetical protein